MSRIITNSAGYLVWEGTNEIVGEQSRREKMDRQKTTADLLRVTSEILDGAKHLMGAGDDLNSGHEKDALTEIELSKTIIDMVHNEIRGVLEDLEVKNDD